MTPTITMALDGAGAAALLAGVSSGLLGGLAAGWWLWGRAAPLRISPAGLPLRVPWPETLPPPRVGRQIWVTPDAASRRALTSALARRLAWAGPVLLLSDEAGSAVTAAPGVYRPTVDADDPAALLAAARGLVGDGILLVEGPRPPLAALLASDLPVLAVLAEGDPVPPGASIAARVDGPTALEAL